MADQYRRWHAADPRLSYPAMAERAARRLLEDDRFLAATWAAVAEAPAPSGGPPALVGYLRAWWRHFSADDPQLMWLPQDHLTAEVFFQFAGAADQEPGALFAALFAAVTRLTPAPAGEPWVLSLVPPVAGLDDALTGLGFRITSVFAYRPRDPLPAAVDPPPGFGIRPAAPGDGAALTRLYLDLCAYHVRNDPFADRTPPGLQEDFGTVLGTVFAEPRRWVLLVAHASAAPDAPLGFALASIDTEEMAPAVITQLPPGRVGFIHDFFIEERARGHGLGRALWSATHTALVARSSGHPARSPIHGTWLIYRPTNPTGARFWPARGYTPLYLMWRRGGW
jgi:GNAT superfamily N-acetyltransferase